MINTEIRHFDTYPATVMTPIRCRNSITSGN